MDVPKASTASLNHPGMGTDESFDQSVFLIEEEEVALSLSGLRPSWGIRAWHASHLLLAAWCPGLFTQFQHACGTACGPLISCEPDICLTTLGEHSAESNSTAPASIESTEKQQAANSGNITMHTTGLTLKMVTEPVLVKCKSRLTQAKMACEQKVAAG